MTEKEKNTALSTESLSDRTEQVSKSAPPAPAEETPPTGQETLREKAKKLSSKKGSLSKPLFSSGKKSGGAKLGGKKSSAKKTQAKKGSKKKADGQPTPDNHLPGGRPDSAQLEKELKREKKRVRYNSTLKSTIGALVVVAAFAVLVATVFLPVLRIYGSSMSPTVNEGEIVLSLKGADFQRTDILAVYYGNKLLVKRCIAGPGQWVDIDPEGNVTVDNELLDEPYLIEKAYGDCTIELPYQVPEGRYFVMGDNRSISQDSRNATVGCIAEEQIVGKIVFRVWPLGDFGKV